MILKWITILIGLVVIFIVGSITIILINSLGYIFLFIFSLILLMTFILFIKDILKGILNWWYNLFNSRID